jgi:hypothetical protein
VIPDSSSKGPNNRSSSVSLNAPPKLETVSDEAVPDPETSEVHPLNATALLIPAPFTKFRLFVIFLRGFFVFMNAYRPMSEMGSQLDKNVPHIFPCGVFLVRVAWYRMR